MSPHPPLDPAIDDELLVRYLIGAASDAETERLDELSVADDVVAARLEALENDLVDAYVNGRLPQGRRERFESHYLSLARGRTKVEFARALHAYRDPAARRAEAIETHESRWLPRWALWAATLLLAVGAAFLFLQNARLRTESAQMQAARLALEEGERQLQQRLDRSESANSETARELARLQAALAQLNQGTTNPTRVPLVATYLLRPATRSAGGPLTISVPRDADSVVLQLAGEADDFPDYRAALKLPSTGNVLWQSPKLRPNGVGGIRVVSVMVPAALLKPEQYVLQLWGIPRSGPEESLSNYAFQIAGR